MNEWSGAGRPPLITVVVLDGEFSGALAYALERALLEPSSVRMVRVGPAPGGAPAPPLPVSDLADTPCTSLAGLSALSSCMVAPFREDDPARVLAELRQSTRSPLVEVDEHAVIVRVSDPRSWPLPAVTSAAG
jgi:hypothetical protein